MYRPHEVAVMQHRGVILEGKRNYTVGPHLRIVEVEGVAGGERAQGDGERTGARSVNLRSDIQVPALLRAHVCSLQQGRTAKHSNGCAHVPAPGKNQRKRTSWSARTLCPLCESRLPPSACLGGLRSDLGMESPSLQSSCRSWMDDA